MNVEGSRKGIDCQPGRVPVRAYTGRFFGERLWAPVGGSASLPVELTPTAGGHQGPNPASQPPPPLRPRVAQRVAKAHEAPCLCTVVSLLFYLIFIIFSVRQRHGTSWVFRCERIHCFAGSPWYGTPRLPWTSFSIFGSHSSLHQHWAAHAGRWVVRKRMISSAITAPSSSSAKCPVSSR